MMPQATNQNAGLPHIGTNVGRRTACKTDAVQPPVILTSLTSGFLRRNERWRVKVATMTWPRCACAAAADRMSGRSACCGLPSTSRSHRRRTRARGAGHHPYDRNANLQGGRPQDDQDQEPRSERPKIADSRTAVMPTLSALQVVMD